MKYLFLLLALINLAIPVSQNWSLFTEKFNPKLYEKEYNNSQYVIPQSKTPISDETLISYAGYRYATGMNPVLINSDHPPLGKYIVGWVTLLTGNNRIVSLLFALGNIIILAAIIYQVTGSATMASLGIFFLTTDSMFIDQIIHSPILDIIQVFFLLLYFWVFLAWLKKHGMGKLILSAVVLGCLASTKLYLPVFVVLASTSILLLLLHKPVKTMLAYLSTTVFLTLITYTITYWNFFTAGNSLRKFAGAQKWIFLFWKNNSVQSSKFIGDALTLILFNQWKVWWGNKLYIQFDRWTIFWPVFFLAGIIISFYVLIIYFRRKKVEPALLLLSVWTILFTTYLCYLPISPRYLLMLFFPIYVLIPLMLQLLVKTKIKHQK